MILKILHWEQEGLPASELTIEDDTFLIRGYEEDGTLCSGDMYLPKYKDCKPEGGFWQVSHRDINYIFQSAYLMNNDGKTIQKYG